jgi:uncharacterized Fe-S cluster protein YjdI
VFRIDPITRPNCANEATVVRVVTDCPMGELRAIRSQQVTEPTRRNGANEATVVRVVTDCPMGELRAIRSQRVTESTRRNGANEANAGRVVRLESIRAPPDVRYGTFPPNGAER